jgi:hypothetical protein
MNSWLTSQLIPGSKLTSEDASKTAASARHSIPSSETALSGASRSDCQGPEPAAGAAARQRTRDVRVARQRVASKPARHAKMERVALKSAQPIKAERVAAKSAKQAKTGMSYARATLIQRRKSPLLSAERNRDPFESAIE